MDESIPPPDSAPVVAHCATPFLTETGAWIHNQIAWLRRWRPVVLTQEARNLDSFPVPHLHSAEALGPLRGLANRVLRRWTGEYPFYAGWLRLEAARLIHAHFGYQGCRCLRAVRATGLPLVTTFYGADATSFARLPQWQRRYRELFARGALFLAEGTTMAQRIAEAGAPAERIRVHHLGVDTHRLSFQAREPGDAIRVLMCGHFRDKKGFPDGIRALGRAATTISGTVRLVVIGDGPQRPQVEAAIDEAGLRDRTELLGLRPYADVVEELDRSHILLQPSRTAADGDTEGGAPVILLDAQAMGVPVVATTHADIPEYVIDEGSGLLAAEGDVNGLTDRLERLLTDPSLWAEMGRRGRRHVEESYDARRQTAGLEIIYDELVS